MLEWARELRSKRTLLALSSPSVSISFTHAHTPRHLQALFIVLFYTDTEWIKNETFAIRLGRDSAVIMANDFTSLVVTFISREVH